MNSKDTILEALRANSPAPLERGPLGFTPMTFEDPLAEFRERVVKAAAARCFLLEEGRSAADAVAEIVRRTYPDARRIASNLPEAAACATFNPDELEDPRSLAGTDVAIVRGAFGVAENGAVWIPRTFRHKALLFIPEALVILLDRTQIVCTMHEAYSREDFDTYDFGSFIAGPSKTADIEQALVIGAHGPRDVSVILL
ncbi:MAG TPA: LUD domain-containing protein [Candidatus Coprenecus merdigallinarum]|nr:LUD domain-containing protein [Candidatus Coprenecus merdigallinarum]HIZ88098.1 LUD domain-containing protein [Candidatus Coprenecus pullistercoris]